MKKDRKKNKLVEEDMDLSIIKESDLDDTASFTDLMSRKERKKHKKDKDITMDLKEINDNKENEDVDFETEELATQIAENKTIEISEEDVKKIAVENDDYEDDLDYEEKESKNIFNTIFISLLIMMSIIAFVYAIIYTNFLDKKLYLIINGSCLVLAVFNYCLMTITSKKAAKFFTVMNYLIILAAISFNLLIYFKII